MSEPLKKETQAQVFSCEFCEISKKTFFYRTLPVPASGNGFQMLENAYSVVFNKGTYEKRLPLSKKGEFQYNGELGVLHKTSHNYRILTTSQ